MSPMTDLERAYQALAKKEHRYSVLWDYYDGAHPLVYANERLKDVFGDKNINFSQNWCAVVVDSVLDRVQLKQFEVAQAAALTTRLSELLTDTELLLDAEDVHKAALVCGESFVIAWPDEDGVIEAYYNDPRLCHVFYRADNPRRIAFAAKWWVDDRQKRRLTLYYPDRFEYYVSTANSDEVSSAKALVPDETYLDGDRWPVNETGVVPVFHFRSERRRARSLLANVLGPQAAFNKLFSDMMVAAEFGAFRQRWVISNANLKQLKNSPNEIWDLPASDGVGQPTQVGEFGETSLGNYTAAMEHIAYNIARITRLPRHYFGTQGGDPSGEALIAMEAPLNKQVQRFITASRQTWRQLGAFLLQLEGTVVPSAEVDAIFAPPETVQPRTQAEIRQINSSAGLPLRTSLRWEGRTPQEIDQVEQEMADEQAASANLASAYLDAARRQFDQAGNGNSNLSREEA